MKKEMLLPVAELGRKIQMAPEFLQLERVEFDADFCAPN